MFWFLLLALLLTGYLYSDAHYRKTDSNRAYDTGNYLLAAMVVTIIVGVTVKLLGG